MTRPTVSERLSAVETWGELHERQCEERQKIIHGEISLIRGILIAVAGTAILTLLGIVGTLLKLYVLA